MELDSDTCHSKADQRKHATGWHVSDRMANVRCFYWHREPCSLRRENGGFQGPRKTKWLLNMNRVSGQVRRKPYKSLHDAGSLSPSLQGESGAALIQDQWLHLGKGKYQVETAICLSHISFPQWNQAPNRSSIGCRYICEVSRANTSNIQTDKMRELWTGPWTHRQPLVAAKTILFL